MRNVGIMRQRFAMTAGMAVISKSDLVILVLASSALGASVYRWHSNTQAVSTITVPANTQIVSLDTPVSAVQPTTVQPTTVQPTDVQAPTVNQVTVQTIPEAEVVPEIVVAEPVVASSESISLGSHEVRSGDYLGKIARQYGTDVQTLRDINGISGSVIQIGQEILYPL